MLTTIARPLKPVLRCLLRRGPRLIEGLPEGLAKDMVDELCRKHKGAALKKASYRHLSAWKATGSYRVILETETGETWRLIFKQANYDLSQAPALKNLPIQPGFPEFRIYRDASSPLMDYLPRVYQCEEVLPKERYHYLLEDLGVCYRHIRGTMDLVACARALPALHSSLAQFCEAAGTHELLRFDDEFWDALVEYGAEALEKYSVVTGSVAVDELRNAWSKLSVLRRKLLSDHTELVPIHGDFNVSNILVQTNGIDSIKVVDWEWTGIGLRHADIASLLKGEQEEVEKKVIREFANCDKRLSLNEHWRLYQWCQIERGVLDAAFLSVQEMNATYTSKLDLRWCVDNSAKIILSKFQVLQ